MLIECGQCGAPLDVGPSTQVAKCRYCGKTSRIQGLRVLAPQTPSAWTPPPRWRPPPAAPADSNVELRYHRAPSSAILGSVIALVAVGIAISAALATRGGSLGGLDPAKLDKVTLMETPTELREVVGGQWNESARWVIVDLRAPFQNGVFAYWGKDKSRPSGLTLNTRGKGCTRELTAAREQLKERLGRRFDGKNWHWAAAHLSFDTSCSNVSITTEVGEESEPLARQQAAALWQLVREVVLRRRTTVKAEVLDGLLGRGYPAKKIGSVLGAMTIDDAMRELEKKLPGSLLSKSSGVQARIPLAHGVLSEISANWENKKAGTLELVQARSDAELADPAELGRCLAAKCGGKLQVREADYAANKHDASLDVDGVQISVHGYGLTVHRPGSRPIPAPVLSKLMTALDACPNP